MSEHAPLALLLAAPQLATPASSGCCHSGMGGPTHPHACLESGMQVPLWGGRAASSPGPKPRKSRRDFTAFDNRPSRRHYWSRSLLKERCHLYRMARAWNRQESQRECECGLLSVQT